MDEKSSKVSYSGLNLDLSDSHRKKYDRVHVYTTIMELLIRISQANKNPLIWNIRSWRCWQIRWGRMFQVFERRSMLWTRSWSRWDTPARRRWSLCQPFSNHPSLGKFIWLKTDSNLWLVAGERVQGSPRGIQWEKQGESTAHYQANGGKHNSAIQFGSTDSRFPII